jgi:ethanolamine ammonia-lyase large subunit
VNYLDLIIDPLNQELVQSKGDVMIGVNPITAKNNTIVTFTSTMKNTVASNLLPMVRIGVESP